MNSSVNHISEFGEDDDGIDWSEACREIDLVCEAASNIASTSSAKFGKNRAGSAKQSTLDSFVVKSAPRPSPETPDVRRRSEEQPAGVEIDPEAAKTWIYPVNVPLRDYQFSITKTALFSNTLVALPTGLGKTLIAAVVIYNYFRWFPDGKIVFAAPSRPLVMQQIEACHNIVGIPQEMTIDMTGLINPTKRACLWKSKRVFFVTPQVLEKDIQSGTCLVKQLVCLVIDEAHRALGNYASSVAVRELMDVPVQLRILALTATPGSKQQTIQQVIDNLRISTLEYRNESDHDVSKYVHNRKIELIQVAMGDEAVEINNKLSDVIRPYLKKLSDWRVLPHRDDKTLSPCELLTSREKFRQAPPPNFSNFDCRDAEGYFGLLITLCHMRKLLLSHGVRPTYEMLEEKMKIGSFTRYMSRNEDLFQAKLIMQRCLSNGAPSPKISKMLEVLLDHFKTKDPISSRVIIFSNFRGSVRDIMDALVALGHCVRATQFIGQSSGKTLKGQSQKVQQAVLEKFRAGGYNVIVATSIGEEGLDIMEVDLVICFDANVSPLRMIQRMGRTGRKHDGRVVVLACEGSEVKAYTRKQANSKTVGKHMRNGGINSFTFHPSPRMVPHIFKPEVQYVEILIEKFVRNGKKVRDDDAVMSPLLHEKLTEAESNLISKYFHPPGGFKWRPSLIAFPHFQTFPSRVYTVGHSFKTSMLIDTMRCLQGLSFESNKRTSLIEDEVCFEKDLGVDNVEPHEDREDSRYLKEYIGLYLILQDPIADFLYADESPNNMERRLSGSEVSSPTHFIETKEKHSACDFSHQSSTAHSYLFGSDFVSVDAFGNVLILSVPVLNFEQLSHSKNKSETNCLDRVSWHLKVTENKDDETFRAGAEQDPMAPQARSPKNGILQGSLYSSPAFESKTADLFVKVSQLPTGKGNLEDEDSVVDTPGDKINASFLLPNEDGNGFSDFELSPRLTNMIKSGFVPESPIENNGLSNCKERNICHTPEPVLPARSQNQLVPKSSVPRQNEINGFARNVTGSPITGAFQTPILPKNISASAKSESPLVDLTSDSGSKNWCLTIGEKSESVEHTRKFKRLRKIGDCEKNKNLQRLRASSLVPRSKLPRERGKNPVNDEIRTFIDDEAEVSSDGNMSDDEEDYQDNDSHDSFIDDRTCPSINAATQSATKIDMMAIYRRSLLTQSPMPGFPSGSSTPSPYSSEAFTARTSETGSFSGKQSFSSHTPITNSEKPPTQMNQNSETLHTNNDNNTEDVYSKTEGRKRKLSFFCPSSSVPAINLEQKFQIQCENTEILCGNDDDDDDFFDDIDFNAVEAQAALLLKQKSETLTSRKQEVTLPLLPHNLDLDIPSFDLGI